MPTAYTKYQLQKTYNEIAMSRPHVCTGCNGKERLSHSHLIPRSRRPDLATNELNIQYHCLGAPEVKGCHEKHESMEVATLNDFESNFRAIYNLDQEYFWLRILKLEEYWKANHFSVYHRVKTLINEFDKLEKKIK